MSTEAYPIIYHERINPQFIGIAQKYSSFKKSRLSLEQKRNKLIQNLKYKMSVDRKLSHSLDQNQEKLKIVQGVNYRHQKQLADKKEKEMKRMKQLNQLNQTIQATRSENKKNIRDALLRNYTKKKRISGDTSKLVETLNSQMRQTFTSKFQEKRSNFNQMQSQKKQGKQTIKEFHLEKNAESLNNYKSLILHQEDTANQFKGDIEVIESAIDKYDSKIEKKKKNLLQVMKKISIYTLQPVESQEKTNLPLYLRDVRTTTSHSSRPSDLLLRGPKNIILNQSFLHYQEQK